MTVVARLSVVVHNAERPRRGALANYFGSDRSGELSREPVLAGRFSHKHPDGATGEFVPMSKRITSGIESSPMKRWPADRVAFRVVQPGIHYTPNGLKTLIADLEGETPPPVNLPWWKQDLTGMTIGQLVVVRYLGDKTDKDGDTRHSRWLVRCLCGEYEHRRGASLRKLASSADPWTDRCWECQNLQKLRGRRPLHSEGWQDTPIPTVPLRTGANDVFVGGERFGRLTVIGYGEASGGKGARWVARCDCGAYGLMSTAGLKKGKSPQQCSNCYYVANPEFRR
jgi:hypothetical protein